MNKLDKEEKQILEAFESGKLKRTSRSKALQKRHQEYADAMFRKDARINIRLSSRDLRGSGAEMTIERVAILVWRFVGLFALSAILGMTCYAVYLSLDTDYYFHYSLQYRDLWEYDPIEVGVFAPSLVASGLIAFLALLAKRPKWLWQRTALALTFLVPCSTAQDCRWS